MLMMILGLTTTFKAPLMALRSELTFNADSDLEPFNDIECAKKKSVIVASYSN